jgi:hypothetical protein
METDKDKDMGTDTETEIHMDMDMDMDTAMDRDMGIFRKCLLSRNYMCREIVITYLRINVNFRVRKKNTNVGTLNQGYHCGEWAPK